MTDETSDPFIYDGEEVEIYDDPIIPEEIIEPVLEPAPQPEPEPEPEPTVEERTPYHTIENMLIDRIDELRESATAQFTDTELIWRQSLSNICNKISAGVASQVEIDLVNKRATAMGVSTSVYLEIVMNHYESIITLMNEIDLVKENILSKHIELWPTDMSNHEFNEYMWAYGAEQEANLEQYLLPSS
jgi:hypothetical protein